MDGITWEQFSKDIEVIFRRSQEIGDNWEIVRANDDTCGVYLRKKTFIQMNWRTDSESYDMEIVEEDDLPSVDCENASNSDDSIELFSFEYHVLYHLSYAVPYLCFNATKSNGSMMTLDEAWAAFNDPIYGRNGSKYMPMTTILTQMEHPILFRPFLTLHPCRIAELLHGLPNSENKVLSYLSTIGPAVHLNFDLKYAEILK